MNKEKIQYGTNHIFGSVINYDVQIFLASSNSCKHYAFYRILFFESLCILLFHGRKAVHCPSIVGKYAPCMFPTHSYRPKYKPKALPFESHHGD
jgi:hypothetical protein